MTEPQPAPPPSVSYEWSMRPTFCTRCEIHQATANKPLCPVCLDDERLEQAS